MCISAMWLLTIALFFVALLAWCIQKRREHFKYFERLGIRGPPPSLLWGNGFELVQKGYLNCFNEWMKEYGPVLGFFNGYYPIFIITDLELIKQIQMKDFINFADRGKIFGEGVLEKHALVDLRGQRWKEVRSVLTPSFTISKLKAMAPDMGRIVDEFMENATKRSASGEEFNIYPLYQALTLDTICRLALGVSYNTQKTGEHPILHMINLVFGTELRWFFLPLMSIPQLSAWGQAVSQFLLRFRNKGKNPMECLKEECAQVVRTRRADPKAKRRDLLQLMIDAQCNSSSIEADHQLAAGVDNEDSKTTNQVASSSETEKVLRLTDDEIVGNAFVVFLAGFETTSSTLGIVTLMLVNYPDVQERLREEILSSENLNGDIQYDEIQKLRFLDAVIAESQRIYPAVYMFTSRRANEARQYGNVYLPKNADVIIPPLGLHMNEEFWPEPTSFNPDRFLEFQHQPITWQPFGAGPRNCIGMRFAQMEIKITLVKLLQKYRIVATGSTEKVPLTFKKTPVGVRPSVGVTVRLETL